MIRIVTESMSDFTQEEAKAADLIVMPLPIRFGMEEYWDDGVSLTQDDFYARLRVAKELPKTSQVPVEHYRKCFNRLLENPEDEVLVITGSSKLSGCYQSACIAREACHDPARVTVLAGFAECDVRGVHARRSGAALSPRGCQRHADHAGEAARCDGALQNHRHGG